MVLCGCAVPKQFENQPERELFSDIHYLAVVCEEQVLLQRAKEGRGVYKKAWLKSSVDFNNWLKANAEKTEPAITLLDSSALTPEKAASAAHQWILERIPPDLK